MYDAVPGFDPAPEANTDGDEFTNLAEYGFGLHPAAFDSASFQADLLSGGVSIMYTRPSIAPDLIYQVEWSHSLAPEAWQAIAADPVIIADDGFSRRVQTTLQTGADPLRLFLRITVTASPE